MKILFVFIFLAGSFSAQAQTAKYTITGKVGNYSAPVKVYFQHFGEGAGTIDSATLANGNFQFKGSLKDPFRGMLVMNYQGQGFKNLRENPNADALIVYVEKGLIKLESVDSISKAKILGSPLNNDNQKLKAKLKPVQAKIAALNNEYLSASGEKQKSQEFIASLQERGDIIKKEQKEVLKRFIKENPTSYISLDAIGAFFGEQPDFLEIESLFNSLSPKLKQTGAGKALATALQEGKRNAIGSLAAEFSQKDVNGKVVKLSDYRGKYLLLDFWASWCGPCRQENPNVVRVYNKYKDKNFDILGVSLDRESGKSAWLKAIKDDRLTWTQVSDLKFWQNEAAVLYGVQAIPQNFLLDPQGKIIAKNLRGEDLDKKLAELIK